MAGTQECPASTPQTCCYYYLHLYSEVYKSVVTAEPASARMSASVSGYQLYKNQAVAAGVAVAGAGAGADGEDEDEDADEKKADEAGTSSQPAVA